MGARENWCQISQNEILHMKFSEFDVPFKKNECENAASWWNYFSNKENKYKLSF